MVVRNASSRSEHRRRTDGDCVGECGLHRQLAFAALADIEGWRSGICPESRDVGEPLRPDPVRLNRHPLRCLDMYAMKSLLPAFDVKAHRIDPPAWAPASTSATIRSSSNVDFDRLKAGIVGTEEFATADPDAVRRSERKSRACGDVERRGGRETRFRQKR